MFHLELVEDEQVISDYYRSGAIPGIYALIALMISQSKSIYLAKDSKEVSLHWFRCLDHFRGTLGANIAAVLARQIRKQVRLLATQIVDESEKRLAGLGHEKNEAAIGARNDVKNNEKMENLVMKEIALPLSDDEKAYVWLLVQLRVFVTSYSLLYDFTQRLEILLPRRLNGVTSEREQKRIEKDEMCDPLAKKLFGSPFFRFGEGTWKSTRWPIVCCQRLSIVITS